MLPKDQELFWNKFQKRMKVAALGFCKKRNAFWNDAEDFAQEAVLAAMNFVQTKSRCAGLEAEWQSSWQDEAYRYGFRTLRNMFLGRLAKEARHREIESLNVDVLQHSSAGGSRSPLPDEELIFRQSREIIQSIARSSKSASYNKIADAVDGHSHDNDFDDISQIDLANSADVSKNSRRDLARRILKETGGTLQ